MQLKQSQIRHRNFWTPSAARKLDEEESFTGLNHGHDNCTPMSRDIIRSLTSGTNRSLHHKNNFIDEEIVVHSLTVENRLTSTLSEQFSLECC